MNAPTSGAGILAEALAGLLAKAQQDEAPPVESEGEQRAAFEIATPLGRYMVEVTELPEGQLSGSIVKGVVV